MSPAKHPYLYKSAALLVCILIFFGAFLQGTPAIENALNDCSSNQTVPIPSELPDLNNAVPIAGLNEDNRDITAADEPVEVEKEPASTVGAETEGQGTETGMQEDETVKVTNRSGQSRQSDPAGEQDEAKNKADSTAEPSGSTDKPFDNTAKHSGSAADSGKTKYTDVQTFNQMVLRIINTYTGKRYPYLLNNDYANYNGVTEDIYYQGRLLLRAHPSGNRASHCVGITFEVFFKAMNEWNKLHGNNTGLIKNLTYSQIADMMLTWYVANGPKEISNVAVAVEKYGLGRRVYDLNEAKAGDFIDFSRVNGTGHTAVFIDWIKENGKIVGLKYWSSQSATKGIAYNREYFNVVRSNGKRGKVDMNSLYIARVEP